MSTTSKSPRKVALVALEVGKDALPAYCHRFSPKVFTRPQLFACLVLKEFYKTDYRGIVGILADTPTTCSSPTRRGNHQDTPREGFLQSNPDPFAPQYP